MDKVFHNKLIRDKIPQFIEANNEPYEVRVMEKKEFEKELKKKLIENKKSYYGCHHFTFSFIWFSFGRQTFGWGRGRYLDLC